jgi:hypothetical protein
MAANQPTPALIADGPINGVRSGELGLPGFRRADLSSEWTVIKGSPQAEGLVAELYREMPSSHPLRGVAVEAIAIRRHLKEIVLFLPEDETWAVVHLTWHVEDNPTFPFTVRAPTWDSVIAELAERGRP